MNLYRIKYRDGYRSVRRMTMLEAFRERLAGRDVKRVHPVTTKRAEFK